MQQTKNLMLFLIVGVMVVAGLLGFSYWLQPAAKPKSDPGQLRVAVSVLPQQQIVERVGGEHVQVRAMIGPGYDPHTFEPKPDDLAYLSAADAYFRIGRIEFELTHLNKLIQVNPNLLVVDTTRDNKYRVLEAHHHDGEEVEEEAAESQLDPHIWLAPMMVKQQAAVVAETLSELDPEHATEFAQNYHQLAIDLDQLDQDLKLAFAPIQGQTMLVYHPAFGYLADAYGFTQEHFELAGQEPTLQQLQSVIEEAKADGVKVIFVQKQFSSDSAQVLAAEIGGAVVSIDPLDPDYFANLRAMAQTITTMVR